MPSQFSLTLGDFIKIWKESLVSGLVRLTEETLAQGRWWVASHSRKDEEGIAEHRVLFELILSYIPSSESGNAPLLSQVVWNVEVRYERIMTAVTSIGISMKVYTIVKGERGVLKHLHFERSPEYLTASDIATSALFRKYGEEDFVRDFLEMARRCLRDAAYNFFPKSQSYLYNLQPIYTIFLEKLGGKTLDKGCYIKVLPVGIYEEREIVAHEAQSLYLAAVVRAPLVTFTIPARLVMEVKTTEEYPEAKVKLDTLPGYHEKIGIDTPFITPTLINTQIGDITMGAILKEIDNPSTKIEESEPAKIASTLTDYFANKALHYLQEARNASKEFGAPTCKGRIMVVYAFLTAFVAIPTALLKNLGYDVAVSNVHQTLYDYYDDTPGRYSCRVEGEQDFYFVCQRVRHKQKGMFKLSLKIDVRVRGNKWHCETPLKTVFKKRDNEVIEFSLSDTETTHALEDLKIAKQYLLNFARQVRDFLHRLHND